MVCAASALPASTSLHNRYYVKHCNCCCLINSGSHLGSLCMTYSKPAALFTNTNNIALQVGKKCFHYLCFPYLPAVFEYLLQRCYLAIRHKVAKLCPRNPWSLFFSTPLSYCHDYFSTPSTILALTASKTSVIFSGSSFFAIKPENLFSNSSLPFRLFAYSAM